MPTHPSTTSSSSLHPKKQNYHPFTLHSSLNHPSCPSHQLPHSVMPPPPFTSLLHHECSIPEAPIPERQCRPPDPYGERGGAGLYQGPSAAAQRLSLWTVPRHKAASAERVPPICQYIVLNTSPLAPVDILEREHLLTASLDAYSMCNQSGSAKLGEWSLGSACLKTNR
jgi:hypothetical protein